MSALYSDLNALSPTEEELVFDENAIHLAITNILNTFTNERLFNPSFGNGLNEILFEQIDDLTALEILNALKIAIDRFESRVTLNTSMTEINPIPDENKYEITLVMDLVGASEDSPLVFEGELKK